MRPFQSFIVYFAWFSGVTFCFLIATILGYLVFKGAAGINLQLVFGDVPAIDALLLRRQVFDGIFPAICGTLMLITIAMLSAVPIGLSAGIYMAEYSSGWSKKVLTIVFDVMAGLPSIVIGLAGFIVTIFFHNLFPEHFGPCLLLSGLSLGFLVLPYIIRTTQAALESVPATVRQTAPALGATHLQNIFFVLLPNSMQGVISGIILAIGRAAEDTAVIMLTGVVVSAGLPRSVFGPYEALPFFIYYISAQYTDQQELARGYSAALILLVLCGLLFLFAFLTQQRLKKKILF